jgi:hypothetical protein
MPVDIDAVGAAGVYRLPAGTYARLLRKQCEMRAQIEYVDPYSALADDWRAALVESEKAEKLAAAAAEQWFAELLAAAEPIVVAQWEVRGRPVPGMPAWLSASALHVGASQVRVYPDDVCEPAAFRGERNGVGFEQVPVPPRHRYAC